MMMVMAVFGNVVGSRKNKKIKKYHNIPFPGQMEKLAAGGGTDNFRPSGLPQGNGLPGVPAGFRVRNIRSSLMLQGAL